MKKGKNVKPVNVKPPFILTNKTAIIILLVLPVIYFIIFAPSLLTGSKMMYGSDWLLGGYPSRVIAAQELANFKTVSMWYHYIFSGLPVYGASIYTFIQVVIPTHIFWTYLFVFGFMIAGIGMYLFLKSLEISNHASLVGAIAYMFAGNLVSTTYAGHEGRMLSVAFFPVAFFFWNKGIMTRKFFWFVLAGALGGFSMTHAHFQLTYYGLWVAFAYFIVQLIWQWQQNKIKESLKLIGYAVITVVIALGILAVNEDKMTNNDDKMRILSQLLIQVEFLLVNQNKYHYLIFRIMCNIIFSLNYRYFLMLLANTKNIITSPIVPQILISIDAIMPILTGT